MPQNSNSYIISLGGSLIVPNEIDLGFLKNFKKLIVSEIRRKKKFVIITGGGKTARHYAAAAKQLGELKSDDLDWLGIHATRLNAHLIRTIFKNVARPRIITHPTDPTDLIPGKFSVLVAGGYKPGCSTDYDAVLLAKHYGIKNILNLSNIDYVYHKDPRKHKDAKKIERISWKEFQKIVGNKWDPGLNTPFDPIASKLASKEKIKVAILNGKNMINIKNYLDGKKFTGTVIE